MWETVKFFELALLATTAVFYVPTRSEEQYYTGHGCSKVDYNTVECVGSFNFSAFVRNANGTYIRHLKIYNTSLTTISKETGFDFGNDSVSDANKDAPFSVASVSSEEEQFILHGILIQNAPNLTSIDPNTLSPLKRHLREFQAIATGLPDYNSYIGDKRTNPFEGFNDVTVNVQLREGSCPEPQLIFPCTCSYNIYTHEFSGLYGSSSGSLGALTNRSKLYCSNDTIDVYSIQHIFGRVASSAGSRHFDIVYIAGENITHLPRNVFAGVGITLLNIYGVPNLRKIDPDAFEGSAGSIQQLQIEKANFTGANDKTVKDLFEAMSSLLNVRHLRLYGLGLPYIPNSALLPKNGQKMHNLKYLAIAFDRREQMTGIQYVGSYAFSGAPKLREIGLIKNFIQKFEPYAFAFNESRSQTLKVEIGINPFNDATGLAPNAFSGSRGPLTVEFEISSFDASDPANAPAFHLMPEFVFRPFLEEHPKNIFIINHYNVEIWCDEKSKWMFDQNGYLTPVVQRGIQIIRVEDNVVQAHNPESIRCKPQSSFKSLPKCLLFTVPGLIHCGGQAFNVKAEFQKLASLGLTQNFSKLLFSTTGIEKIEKDSFGSFNFTEVHLIDARDLGQIEDDAFGALTKKFVKEISVRNTNLSKYPNLANFPNLRRAKLDDTRSVFLSKSTFNYTVLDPSSMTSTEDDDDKTLKVFFDNAVLENSTFSLLNNVSLTLVIGQRRDCYTIACLYACEPTELKLQEQVFRPFLEGNPKNKIILSCDLKCDCSHEWIYKGWNKFGTQFEGRSETFRCADPKGEKQSFLGIQIPKTYGGSYFAKTCRAVS